MKEEHGKKTARKGSFVFEPINNGPILDSKGELKPGKMTGVFVRRKYQGMFQ